MKIVSYRTTMPFNNSGPSGNTVLSPPTSKSVMPFNNVPTIRDILDNRVKMTDVLPHAGGDWSPGQDTEKSYREKGDDYKREVRDEEIVRKMMDRNTKDLQDTQRWRLKVPGGSKTYMSFEKALQDLREKGLPFRYLSRVAQNIDDESQKLDVISKAINKTFMVESIDVNKGVNETGSAFCVSPNLFLTCAHVVKSYDKNINQDANEFASSVSVSLVKNGQAYRAEVVDIDPKLDVALLRCDIEVEPFEIDEEVMVGMDIIVIGSPHGYENNVSTGTVGSLERKIYSYEGAPLYSFIDLSVFPGNSGGPVIKESDGKVIGIVTLIVSEEGGYGLNASLPSSYINEFLRKNIEGF